MVPRLAFPRISSLITCLLGFPPYMVLTISVCSLKFGWFTMFGSSALSWDIPVLNSFSSKRGSMNVRYMSWKAVSMSFGEDDALIPWLRDDMNGYTLTDLPARIFGSSVPENPATPVFRRKSPKILSSKEGRSSVAMRDLPPSMYRFIITEFFSYSVGSTTTLSPFFSVHSVAP